MTIWRTENESFETGSHRDGDFYTILNTEGPHRRNTTRRTFHMYL